eukprot:9749005-Lingulodinium_polyedra.AAC.1
MGRHEGGAAPTGAVRGGAVGPARRPALAGAKRPGAHSGGLRVLARRLEGASVRGCGRPELLEGCPRPRRRVVGAHPDLGHAGEVRE